MPKARRILLVGWTAYAQALTETIQRDSAPVYEVVCAVPALESDVAKTPPATVPYGGRYSDLEEFIQVLAIDIVLVVETGLSIKALDGLAYQCELALVQFKVVPSYFGVLASGFNLESIGGMPILGAERLPLDWWANRLAKRFIDIVGAMVGLLISAPLIALFGLLVHFESPGPILYRQRRFGRYGRSFQILKIRSMRPDAEADGKAGWSKKDDPRRLRIGAFIRKWNIDETPQFWNVLKGEMSLVGPRPERPELVVNFKREISHYNARHAVKPGLTGWAQVNGLRGDTDLTARINHDLYYLEHWNLLFDLWIMILTFFGNKNAH